MPTPPPLTSGSHTPPPPRSEVRWYPCTYSPCCPHPNSHCPLHAASCLSQGPLSQWLWWQNRLSEGGVGPWVRFQQEHGRAKGHSCPQIGRPLASPRGLLAPAALCTPCPSGPPQRLTHPMSTCALCGLCQAWKLFSGVQMWVVMSTPAGPSETTISATQVPILCGHRAGPGCWVYRTRFISHRTGVG